MATESSGISFRQPLRLIGRSFRLILEASLPLTIASAALWIANGFLPLLALYLLKWLVDHLSRPNPGTLRPEIIFGLVGGLAAATLLNTWCQTLATLVDDAQSQAAVDHVADLVHAHSLQLDLQYYDQARYHGLLYRAQQEAPYRPYRIVRGVGKVVQSSLGLLGMSVALLSEQWLLSLIGFLAAVPGVLIRLKHSRRLHAFHKENTADERLATYYQSLLTEETAAKEVRLFDLGGLFRRRYSSLRDWLRQTKFRLALRRARDELAAQFLGLGALFFAVGVMAWETVQGRQTPGGLLLYFLAIRQALGYFQDALSGLSGLYEDGLFLASFDEFLALRPQILVPAAPRKVPVPFATGFAFEHVSFAYPTTGRLVLEDINMLAPPGQITAIVGHNGAGKSTLVKLLCRLYDPSAGRITLDGIPLTAFAPADLWSQISGAFQDHVSFNLSLKENVVLGRYTDAVNDAEILAALRLAGALDIVARFPEGIQVLLGHWQHGGVELSRGEWQKLALARALFRRAPLMILDEPTSSLDPESERAFFDGLRTHVQSQCVFLISHRFSSVREADSIYVLEGGHVVEHGTHETLAAQDGIYARLYGLQTLD